MRDFNRYFHHCGIIIIILLFLYPGFFHAAAASDAVQPGGVFYQTAPDVDLILNPDDFREFYQRSFRDPPRSLVLSPASPLTSVKLTSGQHSFTASQLEQFSFYFDSPNDGTYPLNNLTFHADSDFSGSFLFNFRVYGIRGDAYAAGVLTIRVIPGDSNPNPDSNPDNPPPPSEAVTPTSTPIPTDTPTPTPTPTDTPTPTPTNTPTATPIPTDTPTPAPVSTNTPAPTSTATPSATPILTPVSTSTPTPILTPVSTSTPTPTLTPFPTLDRDFGDSNMIIYRVTYSDLSQLNPNDFIKFFRRRFPDSMPRSVQFRAAPDNGRLYYNYYGVSPFGSTSRKQITNANCDNLEFFITPENNSQYALAELTFLPAGGLNACITIPFTVSGDDPSEKAQGDIFISSTRVLISDFYGATPVNTTVPFPADYIAAAVSSATGVTPASFRLLSLPDPKSGAIRYGVNQSLTSVSRLYTWPEGLQPFSSLRFIPALDYTGPIEIPYLALDSDGESIGVGNFNLGIVNQIKRFSDVNSATWCYKYITELADAGIINGYSDGSFKFNQPVSYGAALKLILLAAGYPEQSPIESKSGDLFSGYLQKARDEKIITGTDIDNIKLTEPITRLQMARIAAGAMKLTTKNLSGVQPFIDTTSESVRALHAAGIVNGYFENGVSSYRPDGTLTRGQLAAIVWRIRNYKKL